MPLSPGDKLGPYEIIELIGKGGMGEVLSRPRLPNSSAMSRWGLSAIWLDPDSIIHSRPDALLAAEVSLGGLDRYVAEQKLNLLH
jgi:hypothetical protein